jgi:hypothetical protein
VTIQLTGAEALVLSDASAIWERTGPLAADNAATRRVILDLVPRQADVSGMAPEPRAPPAPARVLGARSARIYAVYAQFAPHADRAAAAAIEDHYLAGARDGRAIDGAGVLLTGATRRLPPAKAVEPERGFEPLTCSLRVSCSTD